MAGKISIYTLGHSGVILDWNTLEPSLAEDSLKASQNASVEISQAHGGALRKRAGLKKFNIANAGGVILGGTPMAVAGTGGAPATGGGSSTGSSIGTGDGTGAPGGTFDGGSVSTPPAGGSAFGGGGSGSPAIFGGARLVILGLYNNTHASTGGQGWFVTSKKLADAAVKETSPGPPEAVYLYPPTALFEQAKGSHPFAIDPVSGYVFYAVSHQQVDGKDFADATLVQAAQVIRKTNGANDVVACVLPASSSSLESGVWSTDGAGTGKVRAAITAMVIGENHLYIAQKLRAGGQSVNDANAGRIVRLELTTGIVVVQNTNSVPSSDTTNTYIAGIPYCLAFFQGSVYWGNFNLHASELVQDTTVKMYATTVDKTYSVTDHAGIADGEAVSFLIPFPQTAPASDPHMDIAANEILFAGLMTNKATPALATCWARQRGAAGRGSTDALWAASKQGGTAETPANGNWWTSAVVFNDCLYAAYYNPGTSAHIYKFTPSYGAGHTAADGGWNGDGTWTTAMSDAGTFHPYNLYVDDGVLYVISMGTTDSARKFWYSLDGTTFTDESSNIGTFAGDKAYPLPILFGIDQVS